MKPPKQNFLESYDSQQLLFPKDSSNKLSFSISNIYIKQEKLNFIEQLANRNAFIHETKILSMQTKKISYSSSFFTFKIFAKRERRNIHKSDISRSQNGGKGPSITTTLELIRSRKLVTYLYLDTQSASPFSPSLPPSFLPSFLRFFSWITVGIRGRVH